jgi:hypothetical protein
MMESRYQIYKRFQKYVQRKDPRSMNEICQNGDSEFKLLVQQEFLREYMDVYPKWNRLLLYANVGAGKTCTAITMANAYLDKHPNHRVRVLLPARLRTNFIDELVSPCGMGRYISPEDFARYHDPKTTLGVKKMIKGRFMKAIESHFDIYSFEKFKLDALKHRGDLLTWLTHFTKDSLIIIDEVHNLFSNVYDVKGYQAIKSSGSIGKTVKGMNTILFKLMNEFAHDSCKMAFMTATPIFDNLSQFKEVVQAVAPKAKLIPTKHNTILSLIPFLKGKISYFPGISKNAYPAVEYVVHDIPMSKIQDDVINRIKMQEGGDDDDIDDIDIEIGEDAFMSKERQASIFSYPGYEWDKKLTPAIMDAAMKNLKSYSPKIAKVVDQIETLPGKHFVYTNFVKNGVQILEAALRKRGYVAFNEKGAGSRKTFAIWDGSADDAKKQAIKNAANRLENVDGKELRVIIGSPSTREGVTFKHIQHVHLLDPVWNQSAKTQVEGRAIRYCSHIDIDLEKYPKLQRKVHVHTYKLVPMENGKGKVAKTSDQLIYDFIIKEKEKLVRLGEKALRKVAMDHFLFGEMHDESYKRPTSQHPSPVIDDVEFDVKINRKAPRKPKTTCNPKARRPNSEGECYTSAYPHLAINNNGHPCCYKKSPIQSASSSKNEKPVKKTACPVKRRLNKDGKCTNVDFPHLKPNKSGIPCCYKKLK